MASPKISSFPKECEKDCEAFLSTIENPIEVTRVRAVFKNIVAEAVKGNKPSVIGHMGTLETSIKGGDKDGFALAAFYKGIILEMMKTEHIDRKKASRAPARAPAPPPAPAQVPMQAQYAPRVQYVQQQPQQQIQYIPVTQIPMSSAPDAQQQIQYIPVTQIPMSSPSDAQHQIQYVQQPIQTPMGSTRPQYYGLPARR